MFKQGEKIKLIDTGNTYSNWNSRFKTRNLNKEYVQMSILSVEYANRYQPCNAQLGKSSINQKPNILTITSGFGTLFDLARRQDLTWKIKLELGEYFIISSNQNHMLVCNEYAIEKTK